MYIWCLFEKFHFGFALYNKPFGQRMVLYPRMTALIAWSGHVAVSASLQIVGGGGGVEYNTWPKLSILHKTIFVETLTSLLENNTENCYQTVVIINSFPLTFY